MFGLVTLACAPGGEQSEGEARCQQYIERVTTCYEQSCNCTDQSPFCQCWRQNMDLSTQCACVPRDLQSLCVAVNLAAIDPSAYACEAAMTTVRNMCKNTQVLANGTLDCSKVVGAAGASGIGGSSPAEGGSSEEAAGAGGASSGEAGGEASGVAGEGA
jgi:hypothetical protein